MSWGRSQILTNRLKIQSEAPGKPELLKTECDPSCPLPTDTSLWNEVLRRMVVGPNMHSKWNKQGSPKTAVGLHSLDAGTTVTKVFTPLMPDVLNLVSKLLHF